MGVVAGYSQGGDSRDLARVCEIAMDLRGAERQC
jgi:hypothetical protein